MFCRYCGKPIDENAIFCKHCGAEQKIVTPSKQEQENILRSRQRLFGFENNASSKNNDKAEDYADFSKSFKKGDESGIKHSTSEPRVVKATKIPTPLKRILWFLLCFFVIMIVGLVVLILKSESKQEPIEYSTDSNLPFSSDTYNKEQELSSGYKADETEYTHSFGYNTNEDENAHMVSLVPYKETFLENGDEPYGKGRYDKSSLSELLVSNYTKLDAVVVLQDQKRRWIRNVYVKNGSSYVIKCIPNSVCMMKVMQGMKWNAKKHNGDSFPKGGFMEDVCYSESSKSEAFNFVPKTVEDGISYPAYSITLHPVENGNFHTDDITKTDFFTK